MNTQESNNNLAAPSVTIAPRNPSKGVLLYVVTITTFKSVQSYPCCTMEKAGYSFAGYYTKSEEEF